MTGVRGRGWRELGDALTGGAGRGRRRTLPQPRAGRRRRSTAGGGCGARAREAELGGRRGRPKEGPREEAAGAGCCCEGKPGSGLGGSALRGRGKVAPGRGVVGGRSSGAGACAGGDGRERGRQRRRARQEEGRRSHGLGLVGGEEGRRWPGLGRGGGGRAEASGGGSGRRRPGTRAHPREEVGQWHRQAEGRRRMEGRAAWRRTGGEDEGWPWRHRCGA